VGLAAAAALGGAVLIGVRWGSSAPQAAAAVSTESPATASWRDVLAQLDATRDQAFVQGDPALLDQVYAPGSTALAHDRQTLDRLLAAGRRARGLALALTSVTAASSAGPGRASGPVNLSVRDTLPAYDIVGADRSLIAHEPGRGERGWLVELRPTRGPGAGAPGWRIVTIRPAPPR
jgi:hypothetical protein